MQHSRSHSDSDDEDLMRGDDDGDVEAQRRKGLAEPVSPSFLSRRWLSLSVLAMFLLLALAGMRFATQPASTDVTDAAGVDAEAERRAEDSAIEQATHLQKDSATTVLESSEHDAQETQPQPDAATPIAATPIPLTDGDTAETSVEPTPGLGLDVKPATATRTAAATDVDAEATSSEAKLEPDAQRDASSAVVATGKETATSSEPKLESDTTSVPEASREPSSSATSEATEEDAALAAEEAAAAASHAAAAALVPLNRLPFDSVEILPETTGELNRRAAKSPRECATIAKQLGLRTKLVLIGDSITQRWVEQPSWASLAVDPYVATNLGVDGDRTQHVLYRITTGANLDPLGPQAKHAVLLIGTNNLHESSIPAILQGQRKILAKMQEKFKHILFIACLPRLEEGGAEKATQLAEASKVLADPSRGIDWVDLGPQFATDSGAIDDALFVDSVHLSNAGYEILLKAIRTWMNSTNKTDKAAGAAKTDDKTEGATKATTGDKAAGAKASPDAETTSPAVAVETKAPATATAKDELQAQDVKKDSASATPAAAAGAKSAAAPAVSDVAVEKEDAELTPTPLAHPTFAVPATTEVSGGTASGTAAATAPASSFVVETDNDDATTPVPAPAQHMAAVDVKPAAATTATAAATAAADVVVPIVDASPPESFEPSASSGKGVAPAKIESATTAAPGGSVSNAELVESLSAALARTEEDKAAEKKGPAASASDADAVPSGAAAVAPSGSERAQNAGKTVEEAIPDPPPMAAPPAPDVDPDSSASSNEVGIPQVVPIHELCYPSAMRPRVQTKPRGC